MTSPASYSAVKAIIKELVPGRESYTVNRDLILDRTSLIGNKYLIFTTNKITSFNGGNPQTETNYSDNLIVQPISVNAPDLKAESITSTH